MSTRQDILDAVETALGLILTASGYLTDAGDNVYVQRATPLDDSSVPAIVIYDSESVDADTFGEELHLLTLELELVASGDTADQMVRQVETDVINVVQLDPTWGGLADDTVITRNDEIQMMAVDKIMSAMALTLTVEYTTVVYGT